MRIEESDEYVKGTVCGDKSPGGFQSIIQRAKGYTARVIRGFGSGSNEAANLSNPAPGVGSGTESEILNNLARGNPTPVIHTFPAGIAVKPLRFQVGMPGSRNRRCQREN
jgi:hypothetical protein